MRAIRLIVIVVVASFGIVSVADARPRPRRGSDFTANKTFGLGVMLGAPSGLSGKYFIGPSTAFDFGVGAYQRYRFDNAVQIHGDFLIHPVNLVETPPFHLPLYLGLGGRILFRDRDKDDLDNDTHLGVRGVGGVSMDFNNVPIDIFFELALVLDVIVVGNNRLFADLNGAVGIRYYFY